MQQLQYANIPTSTATSTATSTEPKIIEDEPAPPAQVPTVTALKSNIQDGNTAYASGTQGGTRRGSSITRRLSKGARKTDPSDDNGRVLGRRMVCVCMCMLMYVQCVCCAACIMSSHHTLLLLLYMCNHTETEVPEGMFGTTGSFASSRGSMMGVPALATAAYKPARGM